MNERIQELAEQADKWAGTEFHRLFLNNINANMKEMFEKKFAELIVRECADIAADQSAIRPEYRIRKHFGVDSTSIKVGSRVKVVSGFNVGAKGTVSYIEPTGRMWVMRDGASTDVFYTPDEVVRIEQ